MVKTPHTVYLYPKSEPRRYDPITDTYKGGTSEPIKVNAFVNRISQQKVFEAYGDRTIQVIIARFNQEIPPFERLEFEGKAYTPIDAIDAPIKGAVRCQEVAD